MTDSYHSKEYSPENNDDREKREVGVSVYSQSTKTQEIHGQANYQRNTNELERETHTDEIEPNFFTCKLYMSFIDTL